MKAHIATTDDGEKSFRQARDRIVSWDGKTWKSQYLQSGSWTDYPISKENDPTGGELVREGKLVLQNLMQRL